MGAPTPAKKLYDQRTVEYFKCRGWNAFAIGTGQWRADVIAVKEGVVGIVGVKSPNETAAVRNFDDSKNLSKNLKDLIGGDLGGRRERVFNLFPNKGSSIERLYAVTVACQLYRYFHEFEEKAGTYEKFTAPVKLRGVKFTKVPYLVVPDERREKAEAVLAVLKRARFISSYTAEHSSPLYVIEFSYGDVQGDLGSELQ